MKKYGNKFVVYEQESMHTNYDLAPQVKVDIYGIYSSFDHAKRGLRDCAKIAERVWSDDDEETVVSRIIEDEDQIVILKHYFYKMRDYVSRRTSLITIKIDKEL